MKIDRPRGSESGRIGVLGTTLSDRTRLEAIQRNVDAYTIGILQRLPIPSDGVFLELGAGAGSIAYWMADRWPDGNVIAVDIAGRMPACRSRLLRKSWANGVS